MDPNEAMETLEWGPAPETDTDARAWIEGHEGRFGLYINGKWQNSEGDVRFDSRNPATGEILASIAQGSASDVDAAVAAARKAQGKWEGLGESGRARHLYALARAIQKQSRLFATVETLDNGKPIRETRDIDVPLVVRHFFHHAGWARLRNTKAPNMEPWGVCGQVIPWNFPLLMLAWKIAPALAAGNTVVLKPAEYTSLSALLFAETCNQVGLPPGVVNIVTGDGRTGASIVEHDGVDKVAFTGSTEVGRIIRKAIAGSGKGLTLELGGKSPYIIFEDADIDSAVEGLVDAIWFNQGQVCCAGSRLLVQESVAEIVHAKIEARMSKLRIGNPMDKSVDMGAIVDEVQLIEIRGKCDAAEAEGNRRISAPLNAPKDGWWFPPTFFPDVAPSSTIAQEEVFGPVLVSMTFRSPTEAIALANNTRYGLAGSVWSQDVDTAIEIARNIQAGVIWINCTNQFDAAAGFGGYRESGFGREGGLEGFRAYLRPSHAHDASKVHDFSSRGIGDVREPEGTLPPLDQTAKLYIGGKQVRPDGGYSLEVRSPSNEVEGLVGRGNRKDMRNAVEAASKATTWSKMSGHARSQVLWYLAENMQQRAIGLSARISALTGASPEDALHEVEQALDRWTYWASWADKHDGAVHDAPFHGLVVALHEPVGVSGLICPDENPLLGLIALAAPLLAAGNRIVALPSESAPLLATDLYQVLETSDVPAGTFNIITGLHTELAPVLASHDDVQMIWHAGSSSLSEDIEVATVGNMKRSWTSPHFDPWSIKDSMSEHMLQHATHVKNIWIPHGI